MCAKQVRQEGMPWLTPYLTVSDVDASIAFYQKAFGFEITDELIKDEQGLSVHARLSYKKEAMIMIGAEAAFGSSKSKTPKDSGTDSPVSLFLYCDDVDQLFEQAQAAGATVTMPPEDMFWGDRMCNFTDNDGHRWGFATAIEGK